jgi:hydrogenase nickel incorporation protein HypA/HybF
MHELGMCASIVEAIEKRAKEREVAHVRVRVGRLHHVHPEAFEQSFSMAAMGTVAENAEAELIMIPVRERCGSCTTTWDSGELQEICPSCGSTDLQVLGGDELVLESIEYRG